MSKLHHRFILALSFLLVLTLGWRGEAADPALSEPAVAKAVEQARKYVQEELEPKVPGLSIAVGVEGRMVWSEGFGFRDLATKAPVTPDTRFRIGSVSKSLTSAGLVLLTERGQLDLDAPVQKYVSDFPDKGAPITTRLLAGHLAGIRHYRGKEMLLNRPFPTTQDALGIFANEPLEAPPGTKFVYSTYGWTLISAVMESASRGFPALHG